MATTRSSSEGPRASRTRDSSAPRAEHHVGGPVDDGHGVRPPRPAGRRAGGCAARRSPRAMPNARTTRSSSASTGRAPRSTSARSVDVQHVQRQRPRLPVQVDDHRAGHQGQRLGDEVSSRSESVRIWTRMIALFGCRAGRRVCHATSAAETHQVDQEVAEVDREARPGARGRRRPPAAGAAARHRRARRATPQIRFAHDQVPHSRIQTRTSHTSSGNWCRSRWPSPPWTASASRVRSRHVLPRRRRR